MTNKNLCLEKDHKENNLDLKKHNSLHSNQGSDSFLGNKCFDCIHPDHAHHRSLHVNHTNGYVYTEAPLTEPIDYDSDDSSSETSSIVASSYVTSPLDTSPLDTASLHKVPLDAPPEISDNEKSIKTRKTYLWKDVICLSLALTCLFGAFGGLQSLQSTVNCFEGLGFASLAALYASTLVSGLFLPPFVIGWLGNKITLVLGMLCFVIYTIANFYPNWYTLISASVIVGIGSANLWTAQPNYMANIGRSLAEVTGIPLHIVINKVNSAFYGIFNIHIIQGYALSSIVYGGIKELPMTNQTSYVEERYTCGANDCQQTDGNVTSYCNPPSEKLTYILLGTYAVFCIVAVAIVIFFVEDREISGTQKVKLQAHKKLTETFRLWTNYRMILLIPISLYMGFKTAIFQGDFPKSYISCAVGIDMMGYIFICNGSVSSVVQFVLSRNGKRLGRVKPMIVSFLLYLTCAVVLLKWEPDESTLTVIVLFIVSALWGAATSITKLEITNIFAMVFQKKKEAAFANFAMWRSCGSCIGFLFSLYSCVYVKLYMQIALLVLSWTLYFCLEYIHRKERKGKLTKKSEKCKKDDLCQKTVNKTVKV